MNRDVLKKEFTQNTSKNIPNAVVRRLPKYYRILCDLEKKGFSKVSSKQLSEITGSTPSQIRQDFNLFGGFGHQGYGYSVVPLKQELGLILGLDGYRGIILVGCGNLGRAIANQMDFESTGFCLKGIFDVDKDVIGRKILNINVMDVAEMTDFCRENVVSAAVICTPESAVRETVKELYSAGVKSFWNFTHFDIEHEYPDCNAENVCLKDSLMVLCYNMGSDQTQEET